MQTFNNNKFNKLCYTEWSEPEPLKNSVPMQNGKEVQMAYPWMAENRFNIQKVFSSNYFKIFEEEKNTFIFPAPQIIVE